MQNSPPYDTTLDARLRLIVSSYHRFTGKLLIATVPSDILALRAAIWNAPRAIVAHGIENDPLFFYGNRLALQLFEMSFDEFTRLFSRLSAEPLAQEARVKLLEKVMQQGYVAGYSGTRIAKSGRHFIIKEATIWNLVDETDLFHGQAATFVEST
jgi:hypothetical protein